MKTAFSRFNRVMAMVVHALQHGIGMEGASRADALAVVGGYKSRGKGKGVPGKRYRTGTTWPTECGAKQTARYQRQGLHNATVNGFQVIQRA